ncbi:MAG: hypothetical protein EHM12_10215 [Dehalococcoidia bacterium]|nr:MAG: hypothetical protein EHM12_10215 [Dehalococcoidia bacterium]
MKQQLQELLKKYEFALSNMQSDSNLTCVSIESTAYFAGVTQTFNHVIEDLKDILESNHEK